jgi:hypothetical protein
MTGTDPRLAEHALWIMAQCCQGNAAAQEAAFREGCLLDIMRLLSLGTLLCRDPSCVFLSCLVCATALLLPLGVLGADSVPI